MNSPISTEYRRDMPDNERSTFFSAETTNNFTDMSDSAQTASGQTSFVSAKPHMLPVVYFQSPTATTKPNSSMVFNAVQISSLGHGISNIAPATNIPLPTNLTVQNNQGVILTKPQQLVIQKPQGNPLVPISVSTNNSLKNTVALLTMYKPVSKQTEAIPANRVQINPMSNVRTDNIQIIPNMASLNTNPGQKYLLTPMPKISNRAPVTATTNCNLQSKITIMPYGVPNNLKSEVASKHKVFNFKLSNGVQNEAPITVICDSQDGNKLEQHDRNLLHSETINIDSPDQNMKDPEEKTYQLSIVEDSQNKSDVSYTISIPDENRHDHSKEPKYSKQGISILKKSFAFDRKNLITNPIPNSITTISDSTTKEVQITSTYEYDENVTNTPLPKAPPKPERRRKANFSYRKDYDEVETVIKPKSEVVAMPSKGAFSDITAPKITVMKETLEINKEEVEAMDISENDIETIDKFVPNKVILWNNDIGILPGSNLKFKLNEFGIMEILTEEEARLSISKVSKNKDKLKDEENLCCQECGCYGLPSDFVSLKYCSSACQEAGDKMGRMKYRKRKRKNISKGDSSEEDRASNENSQEKLVRPWTCSKKGFSWSKYLDHMKSKGAPDKLFKDPFPCNKNGFRIGMKLEGIDPIHPSKFCVLTVSEVLGYRVRLHFDGYSEKYDFWRNADSLDLFPTGWCEKYGFILQSPKGFEGQFNWATYLKQNKAVAAPKNLFAARVPNHCPNGFRVGMKLEAVDRKNTSQVCVASINGMMDTRILVHFDRWNDIYDYWAEPTSCYIHPVGWAEQNQHTLTLPHGYDPNLFTWDHYLKEENAVAAPVRAFKQRPANGFKVGMKLECVDKRVPHLIRVATVGDVREHQILIKFDGWDDKYSYWVDDDDPDIHPPGWCHKTNHPLEPPLTPDDIYDFLECPTAGCRGQGHVEGPIHGTHTSSKYCPYADDNNDPEKPSPVPDRLASSDGEVEAVVPVAREPTQVPPKVRKVGRPPKIPRLEEPPVVKVEENEEDNKKSIVPISEVPPSTVVRELLCPNGCLDLRAPTWDMHSKHLLPHVPSSMNPQEWTEEDVLHFIGTIPMCREYLKIFKFQRISGEMLLLLTPKEIVDVFQIKIGPALKLYSGILALRDKLKKYT